MIIRLLAHAGEDHTVQAVEEPLLEQLVGNPLVTIPIYLGLLAVIFLLGDKAGLNPPHRFLTAMALSFVLGVASFSVAPALSVVALSIGIALALFFTLTSLL